MLRFVFWSVLFSICDGHDALTSSSRVACNSTHLCSEVDRSIWLQKREKAKKIKELIDISRIGGFVNKDELEVLDARDELCWDINDAGFLFNNHSDAWPIACLSVGNANNSSCSPAPKEDALFDYIDGQTWKNFVKEARISMGCSVAEIMAAQDVSELFICRERCTHSGIGYFQSLLIMFSLFLTVITLSLH
ncbi:unnamed protein product [Bursaphelenchus xylophilus]|uniref:(pine wood nematode) hypothetical protein n=1 Tax=Bursaphelenchus xylophilus TaxID=6326 RepID=A0A1I7SF85_BURXY|nr:unnamed protein product [Bursaphelenchus xylophilus]CAG9130473.1 unnamed protein product [Bursaphelenchus xylophilus]